MLKEKFTKVKQKTGAVIKKTCEYVYENRGIIGWYAGMIVTAAAYEFCFNPREKEACKKDSFKKGYEKGYERGNCNTVDVFDAFNENGLITQTMDGKKVDLNNKAQTDEYISRMDKIQQNMFGHNLVYFTTEDK